MLACIDAAGIYGLDRREAITLIHTQLDTINEVWDEVADANRLTNAQKNYLFGRQILNPAIRYDLPNR